MRITRRICCFLAALMLLPLLAGCGGTNGPEADGEANTGADAVQTNPPETEAPGPDGLYDADFDGAEYVVCTD